jgi:hypothetical protein
MYELVNTDVIKTAKSNSALLSAGKLFTEQVVSGINNKEGDSLLYGKHSQLSFRIFNPVRKQKYCSSFKKASI